MSKIDNLVLIIVSPLILIMFTFCIIIVILDNRPKEKAPNHFYEYLPNGEKREINIHSQSIS